MVADDRNGRDIEEFLDSMKQCSVHNVRIKRLHRKMNRVVIAFDKDISAVIFSFLEVSCSNSDLDLFALQLIYFEPRIHAFLEQFIE